jgi:hypothetical protein
VRRAAQGGAAMKRREPYFLHVEEDGSERRLTPEEVASGVKYLTVTREGWREITKTYHVFVDWHFATLVQPRGDGWLLQDVESGHAVWWREARRARRFKQKEPQ